jgi:hypothetical protein
MFYNMNSIEFGPNTKKDKDNGFTFPTSGVYISVICFQRRSLLAFWRRKCRH